MPEYTCEELQALIDDPETSETDRANYQAIWDSQCGEEPGPMSGGGGSGELPPPPPN